MISFMGLIGSMVGFGLGWVEGGLRPPVGQPLVGFGRCWEIGFLGIIFWRWEGSLRRFWSIC